MFRTFLSFSDNYDSDKAGRRAKEKPKKQLGGGAAVDWRKTCLGDLCARAFLDKRTLRLKMHNIEKKIRALETRG